MNGRGCFDSVGSSTRTLPHSPGPWVCAECGHPRARATPLKRGAPHMRADGQTSKPNRTAPRPRVTWRQPVTWATRNLDHLGCYPQAHESVLIIDPRNPDKVTVDTTTLTGLGHYQCGKVIRGWIVCPIPPAHLHVRPIRSASYVELSKRGQRDRDSSRNGSCATLCWSLGLKGDSKWEGAVYAVTVRGSMIDQWGSIRLRRPACACAPCRPSVRAGELAKP